MLLLCKIKTNQAVVVLYLCPPTCLHLYADPSTADSTRGVRQLTQYADTSCHGRSWKVWTNITYQSQQIGGKYSLQARALVVLTVTRCTHKWDMWSVSSVAWQDSPRERGKCANWATMSAAHVSVWPLHLWEQVGVAWGQQWELKPRDSRCWVTNRRTDFISTH